MIVVANVVAAVALGLLFAVSQQLKLVLTNERAAEMRS